MGFLHKTNHTYFTTVTTEAQAYILGFIYADGCLREQVENRQHRVQIGIHVKDREILDFIASEISSLEAVKVVHSPSMKKAGHSTQVRWSCSSNQIGNDLISLGCTPNKTKEGMVFPSLPNELYPHFIRGFFDGDGGITVGFVKNRYVRKTNWVIPNEAKPRIRKRAYFCSSDEQFLKDLLAKLPFSFTYTKRFNRGCYVYTLETISGVQNLYEYMYENALVYLKRKYNKFNMTIKSLVEDTSSKGLETT